MTEELEKEAENFIIDRYKLNECYREDNAETREYMRMDVHSQYEEEYQLYLAVAEPREKQIQIDAEQIRALQKQNGELTDRVKKLEAQIEKMKCCANCKNYWRMCEYGDREMQICEKWEIKEK